MPAQANAAYAYDQTPNSAETRIQRRVVVLSQGFIRALTGDNLLFGLRPGMKEVEASVVVPIGREVHIAWDEDGQAHRSEHAHGHRLDRYDWNARLCVRLHVRRGVLQQVNVGITSCERSVVNAVATKLRAYFKKRVGCPEDVTSEPSRKHVHYRNGDTSADVQRGFMPGNASGAARVDHLRISWRLDDPHPQEVGRFAGQIHPSARWPCPPLEQLRLS